MESYLTTIQAAVISLVDIDISNQDIDDLDDTDLRIQFEKIDNNHDNFVNSHVNIVHSENKTERNGCELNTVLKNKKRTVAQICDKINEEGGDLDEIQVSDDKEWLLDNEWCEDEEIREPMSKEDEGYMGDNLPHHPNISGNIKHIMEVSGKRKRSKRDK